MTAAASGEPAGKAGLPGKEVAVAPGRVLLLVSATGTGPVRAVLAALPPGTVTVIYRAAGPADEDLRASLHATAAARSARAYYLPGSGPPDPGPLASPQVSADTGASAV